MHLAHLQLGLGFPAPRWRRPSCRRWTVACIEGELGHQVPAAAPTPPVLPPRRPSQVSSHSQLSSAAIAPFSSLHTKHILPASSLCSLCHFLAFSQLLRFLEIRLGYQRCPATSDAAVVVRASCPSPLLLFLELLLIPRQYPT